MLIGISGVAGSGKDTAADYLVQKYNFAKVALADPIKRILKEIYNFSDDQLWGPSAARNAPDKRYVRAAFERHDWQEDPLDNRFWRCARCQLRGDEATPACVVHLTPRFCLQQWGTECGRNCYVDTWVEYTLRVAEQLLSVESKSSTEYQMQYSAKEGVFFSLSAYRNKYSGVVVPDVRFRNEVDAFKNAGAKLIRVKREGSGLMGAEGRHQSESEQLQIEDSEFDVVIYNSSSLESLYKQLDSTLASWV